MQSYKILKLRVIHEETAEQFEKVFNTSMQELAECEPEVEFVHELGFCAYLKYHEKENKKIVESVRDEFALEGICYHCRNCPHLKISDDRRVKYGSCKYSPTRKVRKDQEACELFYKWVQQNAVDVIEDQDLILY